jgi:hypothetical protein
MSVKITGGNYHLNLIIIISKSVSKGYKVVWNPDGIGTSLLWLITVIKENVFSSHLRRVNLFPVLNFDFESEGTFLEPIFGCDLFLCLEDDTTKTIKTCQKSVLTGLKDTFVKLRQCRKLSKVDF